MAVAARPQTARAVGNYFIALMNEDGDSLTPMQLLKLVYIAHGWNLAINGRPLIEDPIEAWKYGPVIVDLYRGTKKFGPYPVTGFIGGGRRAILRDYNEEDIRLAEEVLAKYRGWKAFELSEMTHQPGTPWHTVWHERGGSSHRQTIIPNDLIRDHFVELGERIEREWAQRETGNGG